MQSPDGGVVCGDPSSLLFPRVKTLSGIFLLTTIVFARRNSSVPPPRKSGTARGTPHREAPGTTRTMISMGDNGRPPSLAIHLFGPFEVRLHGAPLPRLRFRKGHWLLALLTLRHGREVERAWLAGTLWPNSAHSQ